MNESAATARATSDYADFAQRLRSHGLLSDPWVGGSPRFLPSAIELSEAVFAELRWAAEQIAAAHDEAVRWVLADPHLLAQYFTLGPAGRALWQCSAPHWHGIARADLFQTSEGIRLCELNSDTPSGQAEAITLSAVFSNNPGRDPNLDLEARFCGLIAHAARRLGRSLAESSVGLLYPTELTEDLGLVLLYERWLTARGARVVLGSPYNLRAKGERVALMGQPVDVVIRHYKTDWWTEREPAWKSEPPFPDPDALRGPLASLLAAELAGTVAVINPFGALIAQNKRMLALLWERRAQLSKSSRSAIEQYLPETVRLEQLPLERVRAERDAWVLKSDYGCEGAETVVGRSVNQQEWDGCLAEARPGRFVVQRAFEPLRDGAGRECNLGIYLVAGMASGAYARLSEGPTDASALSAAVRILSKQGSS